MHRLTAPAALSLLALGLALAALATLPALPGSPGATRLAAQEPMEHAVHIPLVMRDAAELPVAPTAPRPTALPATETPAEPTAPATEPATPAPTATEIPPPTETPALEPATVRVRFTVSGEPFDAGYGVLEFGPFIELLRSPDGERGPWELVSRAETDMDGAVTFEAPALAPNERYRVRFHNTRELFLDSWLLRWRSRIIAPEEILPGETLDLGDAEVVDLKQTAPETWWYLAFPAGFRWAPRPGQPQESYRYGVGECAPAEAGEREHGYSSEGLGYVGEYRLPSLPDGFRYLERYCWYVYVDQPDGSEGWSFYHRVIHFCETRQDCPPRAAIPQ